MVSKVWNWNSTSVKPIFFFFSVESLIPRHFQELGLFYSILYKFQLTQHLKPADHSLRHRYVEWVLEQQPVDGNFSNKIFLSDEAHFALGGCVNKQNCRFGILRILK